MHCCHRMLFGLATDYCLRLAVGSRVTLFATSLGSVRFLLLNLREHSPILRRCLNGQLVAAFVLWMAAVPSDSRVLDSMIGHQLIKHAP